MFMRVRKFKIHEIFRHQLWVLALAAVFLLQPSVTLSHEVNKNAIVLLVIKGNKGQTLGTGTGFIVKPDGTLVTNYHVLVDAVSVEAIFRNGDRVPVQGMVSLDRSRDFSVLKLEGNLYSTLEIGDSDRLKEYDYTSALGYPSQTVQMERGGLKGALLQTYGFILGIHPQAFPQFSFIYTTTPFQPGFSGGPLVNKDNRVVGLATLEGRSINLALPINTIKPHLNDQKLMTFQQLRQADKTIQGSSLLPGEFRPVCAGRSRPGDRPVSTRSQNRPGLCAGPLRSGGDLPGHGRSRQGHCGIRKGFENQPQVSGSSIQPGGTIFQEG